MLNTLKFMIQGRSKEWSKLRKAFLLSNGICAACKSAKNVEVHHIKPFGEYPALELDLKNLITLCGRCHFTLGHLSNYRIFNQHIYNDSIIYRNRVASAVKKSKPYQT
jgi:predicted HNH restriction endonuclease